MKYTVTYSRRFRTRPYETAEVELSKEYDESTPIDAAFQEVIAKVEDQVAEVYKRLTTEGA